MVATCGITIWFIDFDERLFQVFHFENITLSCYPLDILDLNKIEKYCLVLGVLGECSWREFSEILVERRVKQIFVCLPTHGTSAQRVLLGTRPLSLPPTASRGSPCPAQSL